MKSDRATAVANAFVYRFRARHDELDSFGHLNNAVCVKYMQEAAIQASSDAGYSLQWYEEHAVSWVIRRLEVRYHLQVRSGDEVQVRTWLSECGQHTAVREYDVTRVADGAPVARGRAVWVYIDAQTQRAQRLPAAIKIALAPSGNREDLGIRAYKSRAIENAYRYRLRRRVQTYELDPEGRVHHAVFLNWTEQAYFNAIRVADHPLEQLRAGDWVVFLGGHDVEYFGAAHDNDEIEIVSWICEVGKVRAAWTHEVYQAETMRLLARDYSLGVFVDRQGRPIAAPSSVVDDILRGPANRG